MLLFGLFAEFVVEINAGGEANSAGSKTNFECDGDAEGLCQDGCAEEIGDFPALGKDEDEPSQFPHPSGGKVTLNHV